MGTVLIRFSAISPAKEHFVGRRITFSAKSPVRDVALEEEFV